MRCASVWKELIAGLPDRLLETDVTLPWGQGVGALDALADGLAHGFGHVGALAGIPALGGFPTRPKATEARGAVPLW